ncbi:MAG: hypothetical protein ACE14L_03165 [Terriglobales bacterium]
MATTATRLAKKTTAPQVRFLGFSGSLMVFSDSRLIARSEPQQGQAPQAPKKAPKR